MAKPLRPDAETIRRARAVVGTPLAIPHCTLRVQLDEIVLHLERAQRDGSSLSKAYRAALSLQSQVLLYAPSDYDEAQALLRGLR